MKCKKAQFAGSPFAGATIAFIVDPTYLECSGLGGFPTEEVKEENCAWQFKMPLIKGAGFKSKSFLECPKEKSLTVRALNNEGKVQCEVLIESQTVRWFTWKNQVEAGLTYLEVTPGVGNMSYEVKKKEAGCTVPAVGKYGNGTLAGKFRLEVEAANLFIG